MFLDLHPITNILPYRVLETISFAKAYTLFQLGLRHLYVMPKSLKGPHINVEYLV
jgi:chloride channel 7